MASKYYMGFGVDGVEEMVKLCRQAREEFPEHRVLRLQARVRARDVDHARLLHNQIVNAMQRRLQAEGMQMVILPMQAPR